MAYGKAFDNRGIANSLTPCYNIPMKKEEIAKIRRWFGLSLHEMGAKIGAHYSVVSRIESGDRVPTVSQIKRLLVMRERMLREMRVVVGAEPLAAK